MRNSLSSRSLMSLSTLLFRSKQVSQVLLVLFTVGTWHCSLCFAGLNNSLTSLQYSSGWEPKPLGVIMSALVIALALGTMALPFLYQYLRPILPNYKPPNDEPEEQVMLHLCAETNAKYEYEVIFRVGCPTKNFKMKHAHIDFQLRVHPGDVAFGTVIRFDCSKLPDRICGEMHLLIGSAVPINQITGIEANHNMKNGFIFLYECVLIELATERLLEVHRIDEYITHRTNIYRGKMHLKNDSQDRMGQFPQLPLTWSTTELSIIACVLMLFNASVIMAFEYTNLYFWNQDQEGSLYRCLSDIVCATLLGLVFLSIVALCYKYYFKKKSIQYEYTEIDEGSKCWQMASMAYLASLIALSLIMAAGLVYFGQKTTLVKSSYWLCSWLVVTILTFGAWANANSSLWFSSIFDKTAVLKAQKDSTHGKQSRRTSRMAMYVTGKDKRTVFFNTSKPSTDKNKLSLHLNDSISGSNPKMCNPNKQTNSDTKQSATKVNVVIDPKRKKHSDRKHVKRSATRANLK